MCDAVAVRCGVGEPVAVRRRERLGDSDREALVVGVCVREAEAHGVVEGVSEAVGEAVAEGVRQREGLAVGEARAEAEGETEAVEVGVEEAVRDALELRVRELGLQEAEAVGV